MCKDCGFMSAQVKAEQLSSNCYLRAKMNLNTWNLKLRLLITIVIIIPEYIKKSIVLETHGHQQKEIGWKFHYSKRMWKIGSAVRSPVGWLWLLEWTLEWNISGIIIASERDKRSSTPNCQNYIDGLYENQNLQHFAHIFGRVIARELGLTLSVPFELSTESTCYIFSKKHIFGTI